MHPTAERATQRTQFIMGGHRVSFLVQVGCRTPTLPVNPMATASYTTSMEVTRECDSADLAAELRQFLPTPRRA